MTEHMHAQLVNLIWAICNLLRGPYKRNEYRKVILPLTVLRRFDCLLEPTREAVRKEHATLKGKPEGVVRVKLEKISGYPFYNLSKFSFANVADDTNNLAANLTDFINGFSPNVREIFDRFAIGQQIAKMNEKNLLFQVVKRFAPIDLSKEKVDNLQMGYVFEELIRIGAEQANEEAGEHFTPREVIKLMVSLLLSPEKDLARGHVIKEIYDPACGTGGMLSVAGNYMRDHNETAKPILYGQDWNDDVWAVCTADMLIKGDNAENIVLGDTFTQDGFKPDKDGKKKTFDYLLANPPFGVEWKQQQTFIEGERDRLGYDGRFGAGTPRINDGALLFLQHMISKMRPFDGKEGGSRIAIVFNGSPLFTGDAGSGESEIRRWIIENDWLEAIVALPEQLFYNTGIATYVWVLTNRKEPRRKRKVQLIDARNFWVPMRKSLGNKRRKIGDDDEAGEPPHIQTITKIHGDGHHNTTHTFTIDGDAKALVVSKVFDNDDFGFRKITVERPLRLNFQASPDRIARLDDETAFKNLATSKKKDAKTRQREIDAGEARQQAIRDLLRNFGEADGQRLYKNREAFADALKSFASDAEMRLTAAELKPILNALAERDETADACLKSNGDLKPDADLRDTETVPLKEDITAYFEREVKPHVPDAWIDESKTKVGYEIPFNRHFYRYEPPRELDAIEADIKRLESEIIDMLKAATE